MRKHKSWSELTEEEHELEKAKRGEWYRTRSPEYKAELLRKQREYNARKRAEAEARGEKIHRVYKVTQEQRELHSKQNEMAKQRRIDKHLKEIEEQGLTGVRVCSVCTQIKPVKNFLDAKGIKLCKICSECRTRIYATGLKGDGVLGPKFWVSKSKRQNQMVLQNLRKEKPELTMFDLEDRLLPEDLAKLYEQQNRRCAYCGAELDEKLQIDHKIPRCRGGANTIDNVCITCPDCNKLKWMRTTDEFEKFIVEYAKRVLSRVTDKEP